MPKKPREIEVCGDVAIVPLTLGRSAIIDAADLHLVAGRNWYARPDRRTCYASRSLPDEGVGRKHEHMHRIIARCPGDLQVDHIDGDGLNNRRSNLRVVTHQENAFNRRPYANNSTGHKGVQRHKGDRWRAQIRKAGKLIHLGLFDTEVEAASAYSEASARLHGEFGRTA